MATLKVWETVRPSHWPVIRIDERLTYQAVTFTGTAGQSNAFDADTSIITVQADANCAIAVGPDPTATANGYPLTSGDTLDIEVSPGDKISAITV